MVLIVSIGLSYTYTMAKHQYLRNRMVAYHHLMAEHAEQHKFFSCKSDDGGRYKYALGVIFLDMCLDNASHLLLSHLHSVYSYLEDGHTCPEVAGN